MTLRSALRALTRAVIDADLDAARAVLVELEGGGPRGRWSPRPDVVEAVATRDWGPETTTASVLRALELPAGRALESSAGAALRRAGYRRARVSSGGARGYVYRR